MGRKLDLSALTDDEAEHVLQVVKRDMKLRKKEEERLSELKQEVDEEGSRCSLLSKQAKFNERCCMRCCSPFTFLLNPKRPCLECRYNVCKSCCTYSEQDRAWLCNACRKGRILRTRSLEWYYNNVKSRFKRFGSAKVLKTLYKKHIAEHGGVSELTESSVQEGSVDNDGSVCGSDSTFYRQSEGVDSLHRDLDSFNGKLFTENVVWFNKKCHSMAETLNVALRVAEEAIEEAIAKAEEYSDSLEKQNEARYLRDNREDLIEELATTIVQKIIQRRKRSVMQAEYETIWPPAHNREVSSPNPSQQSPPSCQASLNTTHSLWRSRSAGSLTSDESPEKPAESMQVNTTPERPLKAVEDYSMLRRDSRASPMPTWKSMERLDNSSASSMLQSPDGNWIALQSSQLSRPSLLTKRKSLVFSVLEKESGVVSAYDEAGSPSEEDEGGWVAALRQFRSQLSDETYYTDSQHDPEWTYSQNLPITSPSSGQYTNTETLNSDSETSPTPPAHMHRASPLLHPDTLDVNFNPRVPTGVGPVDSSEAEDKQGECIRRARRRKKSRREPNLEPHYASSMQEASGYLMNAAARRSPKENSIPVPCSQTHSGPTSHPAGLSSIQSGFNKSQQGLGAASTGSITDLLELQLKSKLCELVGRVSDRDSSSSEEEQASQGQRQDEKRRDASKDVSDRSNTKQVTKEGKEASDRSSTFNPDHVLSAEDIRKKYSAASLCCITTEVLKVLNATEELIEEATGKGDNPSEQSIPISTSPDKRLQEHLTKLEENVYLAAGAVYSLEGELGDLESGARAVSSTTTEKELAYLEEQVASAAAQVQQSELQISDIEARISALKTAGLNVAPCARFSKLKPKPKQETINSSRQMRRKLPAPPVKDQEGVLELHRRATHL